MKQHILFFIYLIGISLLIWRTYDITHMTTLQSKVSSFPQVKDLPGKLTIKNDLLQYHSDTHLFLLFIGSLFVCIYATYHHIWPLTLLTLMNMYQASIFYYKIHY